MNHSSGVMVGVLVSGVVDRGFEPGRVKPKTIKLVFVKHAALKRKREDCLARDQNVRDGSDMSTRLGLVQSIIISSKCNLLSS